MNVVSRFIASELAQRRNSGENVIVDLSAELQKIYDSEINLRISWLWDGGIEVRLGDEVNGFLAEQTVELVADVVP